MNILSIGGSDPSSGAGIQGDIKACQTLGAHCLTAITGVTSQNTSEFGAVEPVSTSMLREQLSMIFSDFDISAVKIGMVYGTGTIRTVFNSLKGSNAPIVLDPVVRSTTGGMLIDMGSVAHLKKKLVPISSLITPNRFEAEFLTGLKIRSKKAAEKAAKEIQGMGAENVVITGLEFEKGQITDYLAGGSKHYFSRKKIPKISHGSGCNYSLAVCYSIADGMPVKDAVQFARRFAYNAIKRSRRIGKDARMMPPVKNAILDRLTEGIDMLGKITDIYKHVPECQTNFVYSKARPSSRSDVMGVDGRIVRAGKKIVTAGELRYGGSRHVAAAILATSKRFPAMRSAINIRFQDSTISKMEKAGMAVLGYDRSAEPRMIKDAEGASVMWGAGAVTENAQRCPDAIYHRGDMGKEPMIIIFGRNPAEVVAKLQKVLV